MYRRTLRLLTTTALVAAAATAVSAPAGAVSGAGTWTKITTPGATKVLHFLAPPATTTFVVSGKTSNDVTAVNIDCIFLTTTGTSVTQLALSVPVTAGSFSTVASAENIFPQCRLRAVPTDVDTTDEYLGAFSGPLVYPWAFLPKKDGSTVVGYQALSTRGDAIAVASDAAQCGPTLIATVDAPTMQVYGTGKPACQFGLPRGNITTSGTSTASSIKVNGHNAYLPYVVSSYLRSNLGLTLPQPGETVTFSRAANGDETITESAALKRCSVSDVYPPTSVSCPALVNTGVTFKRVTKIVRGSFQITVQDSFISTNGAAHPMTVQYAGQAPGAGDSSFYGAPGYMFPGQSSFHTVHHDQIVTALGTNPASMFIRSDIHASAVEPSADTFAVTWSRRPQKVQFSHTDVREFAMPYALNVPAGGKVSLEFAASDKPTTAEVKELAAAAVAAM